MRKPTICICENKGADQLRSNREADQHLCFRYSESTIPLLLKSEISSFLLSFVPVQPGLCQTWSKPILLILSPNGSFAICVKTVRSESFCHAWLFVQMILLTFSPYIPVMQPNFLQSRLMQHHTTPEEMECNDSSGKHVCEMYTPLYTTFI